MAKNPFGGKRAAPFGKKTDKTEAKFPDTKFPPKKKK